MNRYIVTGGAGFIGSALVRALLADGREVHVIDNLSSGKLENLQEVESRLRFTKWISATMSRLPPLLRRTSRVPSGGDSICAEID